MPIRRLSRETIGQRGVEIYESKLRSVLDPAFRGSFVAIDVETEDYEVADDAAEAENRLWTRHPDAPSRRAIPTRHPDAPSRRASLG